MAKKAKAGKPAKAGKKPRAGGGLGGITTAAQKLIGSKGGGGRRRRHGATWYANQILKEKLKKKLSRIKYGGMR